MAVDVQQLIDDAKCIQTCIPVGMQMPVINFLFAQIAHQDPDPDELIAGAICVQTCIPSGMQPAVIVGLANTILVNMPFIPNPDMGSPTNPAYSTPGDDGGQFTWDFSGFADPDHWQIQAQLADNSWVENFPFSSGNMQAPGADRIIVIDGLSIVDSYDTWTGVIRVIGKDAGNNNVTNPSNGVNTGIV